MSMYVYIYICMCASIYVYMGEVFLKKLLGCAAGPLILDTHTHIICIYIYIYTYNAVSGTQGHFWMVLNGKPTICCVFVLGGVCFLDKPRCIIYIYIHLRM